MYWTPFGPCVTRVTFAETHAVAPIFCPACCGERHVVPASPLRQRTSASLLSGFHLQGIIEAIEIIKQADRCAQFDNLAFIKMCAKLLPKLFIHAVGIARHALCQTQGSFFFFSKIGASFEFMEMGDLLVCPSQPPCQDGVRGQSIFTAVNLAGADDH